MSSTFIEYNGLNILKKFLVDKNIRPEIKDNDKYPFWDGELLLYKNNDWDGSLDFRIPIQVKSTHANKNLGEYRIDKEDLLQYRKEGGILFIVVDTFNNDIYARSLLLADINSILNSADNKSYSVKMNLVNEGDFFEQEINKYKIHHKLQFSIIDHNKIESILYDKKFEKVVFASRIEDFLNENQYIYAKSEYGGYNYVGMLQVDAITGSVPVSITVGKVEYFNKVIKIIKKDDFYYKLGESFILKKNGGIQIDFNLDNLSILDAYNDAKFLRKILKIKKYSINDRFFNINFPKLSDEELKKLIMKYDEFIKTLSVIMKKMKKMRINFVDKKYNELKKFEVDINKVYDLITNDKILKRFPNREEESFLVCFDIFNEKKLIFYVKKEDELYKPYDFLNNNLTVVALTLNINDKKAIMSRFTTIDEEIICHLNINKSDMLNELKSITVISETVHSISMLMLKFINIYDICGNKDFLYYAKFVNERLKKESKDYGEYEYIINKYQILLREKNLNNEQLKEVLKLKLKYSQDLLVQCACNLLTNNELEFNLIFKKLEKKDRELFMTWPIYKLYKT